MNMSEMTQMDEINETAFSNVPMLSLLALPFPELTVGCDLAVLKLM